MTGLKFPLGIIFTCILYTVSLVELFLCLKIRKILNVIIVLIDKWVKGATTHYSCNPAFQNDAAGLYYRAISGSDEDERQDLGRISADVSGRFSGDFEAEWAVVATWNAMQHDSDSSQVR